MVLHFCCRNCKLLLQTLSSVICHKRIAKTPQFCTATHAKDQIFIANVLNISEKTKSINLGTQIHGQVIKLGFLNDVFSSNNLIKMYSKVGCLDNGLRVFDEMPVRNIVSWTLIVSGAGENGEFEYGFLAFLEMMRNGLMPNQFTFGSVLKICVSCSGSSYGILLSLCVHSISWKIGMNKNPFVVSSLLHMYAKSANIVAAERIFEESVESSGGDVGCWNSMIGAYAQCGFGVDAVKVAALMHLKGLRMDEYTFVSALSGCSLLGDLEHGEQIHSLIVMQGMIQEISVINALVDMYFKGGKKDTAVKLFKSIKDKDIVSWNTLFSGFSLDPDAGEIVDLFREFLLSGLKPNAITFSTLIRSCGEVHDLLLGLQFYSLAIRSGFIGHSLLVSSLISLFTICESVGIARSVHDPAPSKIADDTNEIVYSYNYLNLNAEILRLFHDLLARGIEVSELTISHVLVACFNNENIDFAKQVHGFVIKSGFASNVNVSGSLIKVYVRYGLLDDLPNFFDNTRKESRVSWSVMTSALVHQGYNIEAIEFLINMIKDGERPDGFILSGILASCAALSSHCLAKSVHSLAIKMGFELYAPVSSALIDAYSKCGDLGSAKMAFYRSSTSGDVVVFNTMVMAYAHHGLPLEAMQIFHKIKAAKMTPSQATFVSVMSACCHAGLVEVGHYLFKSISLDYGMKPSRDNYGCLVDLLSRYGFLEDAKNVILQMPFAPWPAIFRSFLHGCMVHGNKELAEWASRESFQFFRNDDGGLTLYIKILSEHHNWEDAFKLRNEMFNEGVPKAAACSWIEV